MEGSTGLLYHANIEQTRRPSMAWPTGFADIIHTGPDETAGNEFVCGNDIPRIVGIVASDIPFRTHIIRQFFRNKETPLRKLLVIGQHSCLQIVIAHHVRHT